MKQCKGPCGLEKDESEFYHMERLGKDGNIHIYLIGLCRECEAKRKREYDRIKSQTPEHKEYVKLLNKTEKGKARIKRRSLRSSARFSQYKKGARNRGLSFLLTFEQFDKITKQSCHYCGGFNQKQDFCGVDRVNNEKGYEIENVVPCCSTCNSFKWNYSVSFMINHMLKVLVNMGKISFAGDIDYSPTKIIDKRLLVPLETEKREYTRKWRQTVTGRLLKYRNRAKKQDISFSLSLEQFEHITSQHCVYCDGFSPGKNFCGIDRVDSGQGYEMNNIAPCCIVCNEMKLDYTIDFMIEHMIKMLKHLGKI